MELVVVTRRDCGLCEEMEAVVTDLTRSGGLSYRRLDVDSDPELVARYGDQVPVLLINGRKAFKYRVGTRELRARIRAERRRELRRRIRVFLGRAEDRDRCR